MNTRKTINGKRLQLANAISAAVVGCTIEEARQTAEATANRILERNPGGYVEHMNAEIDKYRNM